MYTLLSAMMLDRIDIVDVGSGGWRGDFARGASMPITGPGRTR